MISIAISYYNRKKLFIETLKSIKRSLYKDYEVVVVDDASDESERLEDLEFPFLKVIRVEKEEKWYTSACIPWNRAIANCRGEIIMLQNPECLHVHDVMSYVAKNINDSNYISMSAYSFDKKLTEDLPGIEEDHLREVFKTLLQRHVEDYTGWYNHSKYNETHFPFCAAISRKNMDELGGFDERFARGVGFEDNDWIDRINKLGLNKIIADDVSVIHQWHPKVYDLSNPEHLKLWNINLYGYQLIEFETQWKVKNSYK